MKAEMEVGHAQNGHRGSKETPKTVSIKPLRGNKVHLNPLKAH